MIVVTEAQLVHLLAAWLWPFVRISGFVMAAPVIGTRTVPMRVKVVLTLALTAVIAPVVAPASTIAPLSATGLLTVLHQLVIGATVGLVLRLLFFVFEFAGQLVAQQMGLSFAALVDPQTGAQVPVIAHFYIVLATLLFFVMNGHLALIRLLVDSFRELPVGPWGITDTGAGIIVTWSAGLIRAALLLGLPIVIALLAVNFALGVMARAAPQLNIFSIGFPLMIAFGIVLVLLTLVTLPEFMRNLLDSAFDTVRLVLEAH